MLILRLSRVLCLLSSIVLCLYGCDSNKKKKTPPLDPLQPPADVRIGRGGVEPVSFETTTVSFQTGVDGFTGCETSCVGSTPGAGLMSVERTVAGNQIEISFLRFDLSGAAFPVGATAVSASLTLYVYRENSCYGSPNDYLEIRGLNAWTFSLTPNYVTSPPNPADGSVAVPDLTSMDSGSDPNLLSPPLPVVIPVNQLAMVQNWMTGTNNGVALVCSQANDVMDLILHSEAAATVAYRPKLEITYVTESNTPPVCNATATPLNGNAPLSVNFTGTATDSDGTIKYAVWYFDDGAEGYGLSATHVFERPGTYYVNFSVMDDDGATATDILEVTVLSTFVPSEHPTIGYHPMPYPLPASDESCAPLMQRPLPSSRRYNLVFSDMLIHYRDPEVAAFIARNMIGTQKVSQDAGSLGGIKSIRDLNSNFLFLQYHISYGLTRVQDWIEKDVWGDEVTKFDSWAQSKGWLDSSHHATGDQLFRFFLRSGRSTFVSSTDSPDWDVKYNYPGMLDGTVRHADDYYYVNTGYTPSGQTHPMWTQYIIDETLYRMTMNDPGYECDGVFFDSGSPPFALQSSSNIDTGSMTPWFTDLPVEHHNLEQADNDLAAFIDKWNDEIGDYFGAVRAAYAKRYLVLPNTNRMVGLRGLPFEREHLTGTDGAYLENYGHGGDDPMTGADWLSGHGNVCKYVTGVGKVFCALPSFSDASSSARLSLRKYLIASFMLVKNDTSYYAINSNESSPSSPSGSSGHPRWYPEYEISLGAYLDDCPNDVDELRVPGKTFLYARWYTGGLVLINISPTQTETFDLDTTYYPVSFTGGGWIGLNGSKPAMTLTTGAAMSGTINIPAATALILRVAPY
ncbi:MAG: PKD domain-containing protein [Planctomycetota bacterium]